MRYFPARLVRTLVIPLPADPTRPAGNCFAGPSLLRPSRSTMIAGIVLAAGRSRRMGEPKAFLRLDGRSFLERAVRALREGGCEDVVVVAGPREDDVSRQVAETALALGARVAVNPAAGSEQVAGLRVGLRSMRAEAEAAVVLPVDVPGVAAENVAALVDELRRTGGEIVVPTHGGRHGHPVLFARAAWGELLEGD